MGPGHIAVLLTVICWPASGVAEGLSVSSKSRIDLFKSQTDVLDNRAAQQYSNSVNLQPPRAIVPGSPEALAQIAAHNSPHISTAQNAARSHGIPVDLFMRLVTQESGWNERAVSPKGAIGLAQLMPATARLLNVNPHNPTDNLKGGARYLRMMFERFGTWHLALAAYNAGPEAVEKYGGVPPYAETQNYVSVLLPAP